MAGIKHDTGKPPLDLLDRYALEEIAQVLAFGAAKYGRGNWRQGLALSRLLAACLLPRLRPPPPPRPPRSRRPPAATPTSSITNT